MLLMGVFKLGSLLGSVKALVKSLAHGDQAPHGRIVPSLRRTGKAQSGPRGSANAAMRRRPMGIEGFGIEAGKRLPVPRPGGAGVSGTALQSCAPVPLWAVAALKRARLAR